MGYVYAGVALLVLGVNSYFLLTGHPERVTAHLKIYTIGWLLSLVIGAVIGFWMLVGVENSMPSKWDGLLINAVYLYFPLVIGCVILSWVSYFKRYQSWAAAFISLPLINLIVWFVTAEISGNGF